MSYTKEGIVTSFPLGVFPGLPVQTGWSFYPIVHKDKKYVVDVHCNDDTRSYEFFRPPVVRVLVFEYKEKREPFWGHKGALLYACPSKIITLDENTSIDITKMSSDDLEVHLPAIVRWIFQNPLQNHPDVLSFHLCEN